MNRRPAARQARCSTAELHPRGDPPVDKGHDGRKWWRGWDSNPQSRAHEAREIPISPPRFAGGPLSTAPESGRQDSNLRSPAPVAGVVTDSTTARGGSGARARTWVSRLTTARRSAGPRRISRRRQHDSKLRGGVHRRRGALIGRPWARVRQAGEPGVEPGWRGLEPRGVPDALPFPGAHKARMWPAGVEPATPWSSRRRSSV